jgi:DNA recombination protein RmuC
MEIAFIVVGIIVGLVIGLLVGRSKSSAAEARYAMLQDQKKEMETSMESALSVRLAEQKQTEEKRLAEQKANYEETIANLKENFNAQNAELKARFNETIEKVTAQVKTATDTMLKERQKEFAENSNQSLGQIVNPLRETIDKMKKAMEENTEKQTSMSGEMRANIEHMMRQSMEAKKSADELTRVFKHGTKVQGDWGETVLDELLQSQGLTKGIHYDTQAVIKDATGKTVRSEEGSIMRPDVILHLDQRRELIIDSKVSLTAFIDYVNADNEDDRQHYLKAHIDSLQKHVKELSAKDYSSYIQAPKVKMDYVIMFVPHTGALWTALNAQPDLWRRAMEKNVFIADEQTLFAALRIINLTWTQIVQAQNHEKVFALANEMLNRVGQCWNEYEAMGKALEKAAKAYEDGKKKITDGGQSINTTANQLIKLGAKQSDRNPIPQLIDIDEIEAKE